MLHLILQISDTPNIGLGIVVLAALVGINAFSIRERRMVRERYRDSAK